MSRTLSRFRFVVVWLLICLGVRVAWAGEPATCPAVTCELPADVGPCDAAIPRFFYNSCTGVCELFIYGGCEGNANNFETISECKATCPPADNLCYLPPDVGPCDGICPRYFYNPCTDRCEEFDYGCCGGNANNFETVDECLGACPGGAPTCASNCDCVDSNVCTFDACQDDQTCAHMPAQHGDVAGFGGRCGPDNDIDIFDILKVLDGFAGRFSDGCEVTNLDIAGASATRRCDRDGQVDIFDVIAVLDAFQGKSACCSNGP